MLFKTQVSLDRCSFKITQCNLNIQTAIDPETNFYKSNTQKLLI